MSSGVPRIVVGVGTSIISMSLWPWALGCCPGRLHADMGVSTSSWVSARQDGRQQIDRGIRKSKDGRGAIVMDVAPW